jgi:polar amino acid transport system substrate-binding protein
MSSQSRKGETTMTKFSLVLILSLVSLTACVSPRSNDNSTLLMQQIAPTGKLRAAISVGPAGNQFRATIDPATNQPRGVPVDLANALGQKLGVPVQLVTYSNYVDLLEAAGRDAWDVTFLTFDQERAKVMDFGPAYFLYEFTYLVPAGSTIQSQSEVDRPGVRISVTQGPVTARNREQSLKSATLKRFKTLAELLDQVRAGNVDAAAAGRETLAGLAARLPGARVLDGSYYVESVAIAVPKGRPASLAYVSDFIETAKATGLVRQAFDSAGFKQAAVAPPALRR